MSESDTITTSENYDKVVVSNSDCCTTTLAIDGPIESPVATNVTNEKKGAAAEISSTAMEEQQEESSAKSSEASLAAETNIQMDGKESNEDQDDCWQPITTKCERPPLVEPPLPPMPPLSGKIGAGSSTGNDENNNKNHNNQEAKLPIDTETKATSSAQKPEAAAAQPIAEIGDGEIGDKTQAAGGATAVVVELIEQKLLGDAPMDRDIERKVPLKTISLDQFEKKPSIVVDKNGWIRHIVAILALSSILLANMNRQVFNQALPSMILEGTTASESSGPIEHEIIPSIAFADSPPAMNLNYTDPSTAASHAQNPQQRNSASALTDDPTTTTRQNEDLTTTAISTTSEAVTTIASESSGMANVNTIANFASRVPPFDPMLAHDRFNWTKSEISVLQAAFSYGYMPFMIPGGRMAELYGAKWVVFVSGFGSALCCVMTPLIADNFHLLVASRIIMGISQTAISPALYALLTRWLAPDESSIYLPMIKVGVVLGFAVGSLSSGLLSWRMAFYTTGFIGFLWCLLWTFMVTSDPAEHKLVSDSELEYVEQEIRRLNKGSKQSAKTSRKAPAPWLRILTNPVILSFMAAKFSVKLSTDAQTTQLPMYLEQIFHVSKGTVGLTIHNGTKHENAFIVATNFVIQCVFTGLVAWAAKECVVKGPLGLNKTGVRRLFQGICNFGMSISYLMLTVDMNSLSLAIFAVVVLAVTSMFGSGGEAVLPIDLSVEYSASIMAIANSIANLSGIVLPAIVKSILSGSDNNWAMVWWFVGATVLLGGLAFVFGVEAEIQDFRSTRGTNKETVRNNEETEKGNSLDGDSDDFTKIELTAF